MSSTHPPFETFPSRRSVVYSTRGIVACTQPLAAQAGVRVLQAGGTAADAAVATAAALGVTEPSSTGIGGDCFCLYYDAQTRKVEGLNGSGRSPRRLSLEEVRRRAAPGAALMDGRSECAVTVPGAPAGWLDALERWGHWGGGREARERVLAPAIELAAEGFPVSEVSSFDWCKEEQKLRSASSNSAELLVDGERGPRPGEVFRSVGLAKTYSLLAEKGKPGFYEGELAQAMVDVVQERGGFLSLEDLKAHGTDGATKTDAISLRFSVQGRQNLSDPGSGKLADPKGPDIQTQAPSGDDIAFDEKNTTSDEETKNATPNGIDVWEHPPNGQGLVPLMTLGILEELEQSGRIRKISDMDHNSVEYLHVVIEALRIAFADAAWWTADPDHSTPPLETLLSRSYLAERARLFDPHHAGRPDRGRSPAFRSCDTVYFAVTDAAGNAASFFNSVYAGFGSGMVPRGYGFALQSRGAAFALQPDGHPNCYAPGKRPFHTLIPAMVTDAADQRLHAVLGVMGAFMQPQGQVQVLLNMRAFGMSPQAALDAPRVCIGAGIPDKGDLLGPMVQLEEGFEPAIVDGLDALGHKPVRVVSGYARSVFGRGQIIRCRMQGGTPVYSAGSDPRGDGAAFPA